MTPPEDEFRFQDQPGSFSVNHEEPAGFSLESIPDSFEMAEADEETFALDAGGDGFDFEYWQGLRGPYYTPSVSDNGVISWKNNGQLPNPDPINIRGPSGRGLTIGGIVEDESDLPEAGEDGVTWLVGSASPYEGFVYVNGAWADIGEVAAGPQGDQGTPGADGAPGSPGAPGADGVTFTPSVSENGVISWTNDGGEQNPEPVDLASIVAASVQASILDAAYPIGSIYMSANNTSPATLFGGTWTQLEDRFLLGAGQTYMAGDTGGEAAVTLTAAQSGLPAHSHALTNPTVDTGGGHQHTITTRYTGTKVDQSTGSTLNHVTTSSNYSTNNNMVRTEASDGTHSHSLNGGSIADNTAADASAAHNNMPPYLVVYMWQRTA